tara:strand:+ start:53 stop:193 length:141 start_codon:yes stop_codon:yes gene_type:complete
MKKYFQKLEKWLFWKDITLKDLISIIACFGFLSTFVAIGLYSLIFG